MAISLDRVNAACRGCENAVRPEGSRFGFLYITTREKQNGFTGTRAVFVGPGELWCNELADPVNEEGVCDAHVPMVRKP